LESFYNARGLIVIEFRKTGSASSTQNVRPAASHLSSRNSQVKSKNILSLPLTDATYKQITSSSPGIVEYHLKGSNYCTPVCFRKSEYHSKARSL